MGFASGNPPEIPWNASQIPRNTSEAPLKPFENAGTPIKSLVPGGMPLKPYETLFLVPGMLLKSFENPENTLNLLLHPWNAPDTPWNALKTP